MFLSTATVLGRCVLLVCTFLLLPPATWPTHAWAGYVVSASSRPLANALALSVYDQFAKVRWRLSPSCYCPCRLYHLLGTPCYYLPAQCGARGS